MQNCKSISAFVAMFHNQLLHCNVCILHCSIIKCVVRNDDVSFTRNKRVNERIIHHYTLQEEVQFPCKISGPLFTWFTFFDISMHGLHYKILSGPFFQEVKGNYMPVHYIARMKTWFQTVLGLLLLDLNTGQDYEQYGYISR